MKKILALLFFFTADCFAAEPHYNLSDVKKELRAYHDTRAYDQDVAFALNPASAYLTARLLHATPEARKKMAVVFDIDETLLSNYPSMLNNDFGAPPMYIVATMHNAASPALAPSLDFYKKVQAKGVAIFLITGRHEDVRPHTIQNLQHAGYSGWQRLYLEPTGAKFRSAADFKATVREDLIHQGYDIVLSVGDQCSDLAEGPDLPKPVQTIPLPKACGSLLGAYEDAAVKLPNPYYFVA